VPKKKLDPTVNDMKTKLNNTRNDMDEQTRCAMISSLWMAEAHLQSKD
jgi:hypothetical protein